MALFFNCIKQFRDIFPWRDATIFIDFIVRRRSLHNLELCSYMGVVKNDTTFTKFPSNWVISNTYLTWVLVADQLIQWVMKLLLILDPDLEGKVVGEKGVAGDKGEWGWQGGCGGEEHGTVLRLFFLREGGGGGLVPSYMLKIDTLFTFIICIIHMCLYDTP